MSRGFGVASGLDPAVAAPLGARCAELGYASLWSNDTPLASGLETLGAFADAAPELDLGVTIAIDRHPPAKLAEDIDRLGLDRERLWMAVAAGTSPKSVSVMREAEPTLRSALRGARLVLAAMGPRMCKLAGELYDGAFLNWMTPEFAASARELVEEGARKAGRRTPPVLGYVRTAIGPDAAARLAKEEGFYRELHAGYRNHFARLGEPEGTVGVAVADREEAQAALGAYGALDVSVVRALASANVEAMTALAEAAAPQPQ